MEKDVPALHYCERCEKTMASTEFYRSRNTEKYTDAGLLNQCKKCITAHVDNWNPETYLWILQEIDVPYIPDQWNMILQKYVSENKKITKLSILGRYLSKMQLAQHNKYHWKDTQMLQEMADKKVEETMLRQGYDMQAITETINKGKITIPDRPLEPVIVEAPPRPGEEFDQESQLADLGMELSDEDKVYLRLKWGKSYKPEEWIALEKLYNEMMESYEISTAGHIDTLKMVCKTSLKANQLLDIGDIDGAQKMIKMYDALMKSGKFKMWTMKNFTQLSLGVSKIAS